MNISNNPIDHAMSEPLPDHIQSVVDSVCNQGCKYVNKTILALETSQPSQDTDHLPADEKDIILNELRSIMAIYQQNNPEERGC